MVDDYADETWDSRMVLSILNDWSLTVPAGMDVDEFCVSIARTCDNKLLNEVNLYYQVTAGYAPMEGRCPECYWPMSQSNEVWLRQSDTVRDPTVNGFSRNLNWSERGIVCDLCVACGDYDKDGPYRGTFHRPHLMNIYHPEVMYGD